MSASLSGCVKTHTSAKCGKYNSPTRYRAICAQHDLALMMRNDSNMFLRARRAFEFSHGLDPIRTPTVLANRLRVFKASEYHCPILNITKSPNRTDKYD